MKKRLLALLAASFCIGNVNAATIYTIGSDVDGATSNLTTLGHSVSTGSVLTDYSAYDQVWDLRILQNLTPADQTSMGNYLASGGRMFLTGENDGFDTQRNNTLVTWISNVGGGSISLTGDAGTTLVTQSFTTEGALVNSPNTFASLEYNAARTVSVSSGNAFLVTEKNPGEGSLLGWDFGDISGASNARMIIGFDAQLFSSGTNGINFTENVYSYLASPVPLPAAFWLMASGLLGLVSFRKKRA